MRFHMGVLYSAWLEVETAAMAVTQDRFDRFLNDITQCFIEKDFELWRSHIVLPFSLVTERGPVVLNDVDALRQNFNLYLMAADVMRLDQVVREALLLEDCGDGTWLGTYETRLISRGGLATSPYVSTAMLQEADDRLKMTSVLNARGFHEWVK